jgi:hypothetical protein
MLRLWCFRLAPVAFLFALQVGVAGEAHGQNLPDEVLPGIRIGFLAGPCSHGKIDLNSCQLYQADIQFYRPFSAFRAQPPRLGSRLEHGDAGTTSRAFSRARRADEYITGVSLGVTLGSAPNNVWPVPPPPPSNDNPAPAAKAAAVAADDDLLNHGGTLMGTLDVFLPIPLSEAFHIEPFVSIGVSKIKEGAVEAPNAYGLEKTSMPVLSYGSGFSLRLAQLPVDLRAQLRGFLFFPGEVTYLAFEEETGGVIPYQRDIGSVSLFSLTFGVGLRF